MGTPWVHYRKNLTFRVPPFKVTEVTATDTERSATYEFLLVFLSNYGPISHRLLDKGQYLQKNLTPFI